VKVAVVGGTGVLGALLAAELAASGDEVLALSRKPRGTLPRGAVHRRVDLSTGEGLTEALSGVEVVLDSANTPPNRGKALVAGTRRLLTAAAAADVRHLVGISIVGCDQVPMPYYKAKVEQEEAIAAGEVPWSLLRATQFHTLVAWAFEQAGRFGVIPTGRARLQPIAPAVVAARLVEVAQGEPTGRVPDVAGPEVQTLGELAATWRRHGHRGLSLRIPTVGKIGRPIGEGALTDPDATAGGPNFESWLADG